MFSAKARGLLRGSGRGGLAGEENLQDLSLLAEDPVGEVVTVSA